jgi:hypothetical protein
VLFHTVHLAAFLEASGGDVVPAAGFFEKILEQVPVAGPIPPVMMRVDNRQIGFEDFLAALVQPIRPNRRMAARAGLRLAGDAGSSPSERWAAATLPPRRGISNCFD